MSLSKVYSTQDTFQPEDIIRARLHGPPEFGGSLITSGPGSRELKKKEFTHEPLSGESTARQNAGQSPSDRKPAAESTPKPDATQPQQEQKPVEPPDTQTKMAHPPPPPPPAGVPEEEVEWMVSAAYEKGRNEGLQQAEEDFGTAAAALQQVCQQLDNLRETILQNSIGELRELVIAIAEKILRHSVKEQDQTIIDTVEEAIQSAVRSEEFYIYVNPADYAVIAAKAEEMVAGLNGLNNIVVKKDPNVERGGCRLESENCTVDATISGQLESIRENLEQQ